MWKVAKQIALDSTHHAWYHVDFLSNSQNVEILLVDREQWERVYKRKGGVRIIKGENQIID